MKHHAGMSISKLTRRISDLERKLSQIYREGVITHVKANPPRARVDIEGRLTGWLPWTADKAGRHVKWQPREVGEQVGVFSPNGDPAQARIVPSFYYVDRPSPSHDLNVVKEVFPDGMFMEHNHEENLTRLSGLDSQGTLVLEFKNIIIRTGENGYIQHDNHGRATRLTHLGGNLFKSESWTEGSIVTPTPDQGYSPDRITSPDEGEAP
jgi:phage baseplate assembly protein V